MLKVTLPALILACSASPRAEIHDTLYRIAIAHARGQANYIYNASTDRSYIHNNLNLYRQLVASHHKVHLGLMGLARQSIDRYKLSDVRAFDVCTNVRVASMELARLMPHKTNETGLHKVLAKYFDPLDPKSTSAIDWGAMILAQPKVSVKAQHAKRYQRATVTYIIRRKLLRSGSTQRGQMITHVNETKPVKFKLKDKTKPTPSKEPAKSSKDLAPYQKGGALKPVTDRRLK